MSGLATTYEDTTDITYEDQTATHTKLQWSGVIPAHSLSLRQIEAVIGVLQIANLQHNWDSYGSPPPSRRVVDTAINLLTLIDIDELTVPCVVPVSGGGIQIEWRFGAREVELEILSDGSVEFLKSERGNPLDEGKLTPVNTAQVQSLLSWLILR